MQENSHKIINQRQRESDRLSLLFDSKISVAIASFVISISLYIILKIANNEYLDIWLASNLFFNFCRLITAIIFKSTDKSKLQIKHFLLYEKIFTIIYLLFGFSWGLTAFYMVNGSFSQIVLVSFLSQGVLFGGIVGTTHSKLVSYTFLIAGVAPYTFILVYYNPGVIGAAILFGGIIMAGLIRRVVKSSNDNYNEIIDLTSKLQGKLDIENKLKLMRAKELVIIDRELAFQQELVLINEEKAKMQEQLFQSTKLAAIGEISAGVGHEINNPLAISIGNITSLEKEFIKDNYNNKVVNKKLENIREGHERIRKIVDGLRTYARSDIEHNEVISMREAIDQTVNLISGIYEKDCVSIEQSSNGIVLYTRGSLGKLQQIIMNLISNAKDATDGQKKREINLSLKDREDGTLMFSVKDNGSGIPSDIRDKILNPFFTTKGVGVGTGMGLGIISGLIKEMKGELLIDSEVGKGSTFSIILPSIDGTEFTTETETETETEKAPLKGVALVIDDEEGIRELLIMHLEDLGLEVEEADDGDTALEMVKLKKYDYICTDMKMKRISGDDFILQARELPYGDTKYFVVTGGISGNNIDRIKHIISGYIAKPFSEESICEALSKSDLGKS